MNRVLLVGAGGFIGASSRYLLTLLMMEKFGPDFPYGTLLVNVLGGFLIGIIMQFSLEVVPIKAELRLFLTTGILGGLTTFSTFAHETIFLFLKGSYIVAGLNIVLNLILTLCFVVAGQYVVKIIF